MPGAKDFFSEQQKDAVAKAIAEAEMDTSGEIRVHVEDHCKADVVEHAKVLFHKLKMDQTELANGVLFYLAVKDHKFAIVGDKGIDTAVPADFWDQIKERLLLNFKEQKFTEGLCQGIQMAGEKLKQYFPYKSSDKNELGNEISFNK